MRAAFRPALVSLSIACSVSHVAFAQPRLPAAMALSIDTVFTAFAHAGSPGCAVGVYQRGVLTFARGYGFANLTNDVPITPQTRFTVGSVSKQFTAASIALLVRAGRLSLDDDVRKYVPELPTYGAPITIRHLVHHTSGLRDFWELVDLAGMRPDDGYAVADMMSLIARQQALNFTPGAEYRYSNSGYLTLGVVVQRITGQSLRRFADSAIFRPLGMRETLFLDDHNEIVSGRAMAYSPNALGWRVNIWNNDLVGQGGIVTSLADLQRWDDNFYSAALGGREFIDLLQTTDRLNSGAPNQYAFGLEVESYRGVKLVQHTGSTGGYRAAIYRFPEQHTSVTMLCNTSTANTSALSLRVADVVLRDVLGPMQVAATRTPSAGDPGPGVGAARASDRAIIAGRYVSAELNDSVWEIVAGTQGSPLQLKRPRNTPAPLVALDSVWQYRSVGGLALTFDAPVAGHAPGFKLSGSRVNGIHFVRLTK